MRYSPPRPDCSTSIRTGGILAEFGDAVYTVWFGRQQFQAKSVQHYGEYTALQRQKKARRVCDVTTVCHAGDGSGSNHSERSGAFPPIETGVSAPRKLMEKQSEMITLPCDCKCCMLVIEKTVWEDGDVDYDISIQDSRYDHNYNTLWGRIKRAFRVLFGKPIYYNDVYMGSEADFRKLIADMERLEKLQFKPELNKDA